jgi:hypothetical protein
VPRGARSLTGPALGDRTFQGATLGFGCEGNDDEIHASMVRAGRHSFKSSFPLGYKLSECRSTPAVC